MVNRYCVIFFGLEKTMNNLYLFAAFLIGVLFACQAPINTTAAKAFGAPCPATVFSIGITLIASMLVMFIKTTFLSNGTN